MPGRLAAAIRGYFETRLTGFAQAGEGRFAYPLEPEVVLDHHAADGIEAVWNLPYAHRPGVAARLNADIAAMRDRLAGHPVSMVAGCTIHPNDPDPAGDLRRAAEQHGARVCKLHCSVGRYTPTERRLAPVYEAAAELAMPIVIHVGHAEIGDTEPHELAPMAEAAVRYPGTTFVIAHAAAPALDAALALLDAHANVCADLTPTVDGPVPIRALDAERFSDRLLFGSDAPNTGPPAGVSIDRLLQLDITDATRAALLGGNARRLAGV